MVYILNMQKHTLYRIINIIIFPVSILIGIEVVRSLIVAFSNPPLLLFSFILACIPLYTFTANYFYNKSIRKGEKCKPSLKEWIKANAVVSIIFAVFMIFVCSVMLVALDDPKIVEQFRNQLPANTPAELLGEKFTPFMRGVCYFFIPFSILLLIHIIITFNLLTRYKQMFGYSTNDPQ
jgi:hypothetical protein